MDGSFRNTLLTVISWNHKWAGWRILKLWHKPAASRTSGGKRKACLLLALWCCSTVALLGALKNKITGFPIFQKYNKFSQDQFSDINNYKNFSTSSTKNLSAYGVRSSITGSAYDLLYIRGDISALMNRNVRGFHFFRINLVLFWSLTFLIPRVACRFPQTGHGTTGMEVARMNNSIREKVKSSKWGFCTFLVN